MKYGLLTYDEFDQYGGQNIGDYVQSLAARQFLPKGEKIVYLKRDHLNSYDGEELKLIMNGWFSHIPENFLPSDKIQTLFIAFHLNSTAKDEILTPRNIDYLKKNAPIGCRDKYTENLLKEKGIDSYFSGCLTLTLGNTYKVNEKTNKVYFIDPYIGTKVSKLKMLKAMIKTIKHSALLKSIQKKMICKKGIKGYILSVLFYEQYSKVFKEDLLENAEYLHNQFHCNNDIDYFNAAEDLIYKYASAKLVITSRIHAALPCTGLETPVIFVNNINDTEVSTCRFDGLIQLLNVMNHDGKKLLPTFNFNDIKIKKDYESLAFKMSERCKSFILLD